MPTSYDPHPSMVFDRDTRLKAAIAGDRTHVVWMILSAFERGGDIGRIVDGYGQKGEHIDALNARLRAIRDDLVELDLYRLHFGGLPAMMHHERAPVLAVDSSRSIPAHAALAPTAVR